MSIPIAVSPGRGGFGPQLALNYDSGSGQSAFGLGWSLSVPSIVRKTDKGLPRYLDGEESDVFLLSGAEDLVPVTEPATGGRIVMPVQLAGILYNVHPYRPRIEGLFARIERWVPSGSAGTTFWRTISRDNVTTWFGRTANSQIFDPGDPAHIFQWLICETSDDRGNVAIYEYLDDSTLAVDAAAVWEANREPEAREANRYLKRIRYGNPPPSYLPRLDPVAPDVLPTAWMFEVVLDYGDHTGEFPTPEPDEIQSSLVQGAQITQQFLVRPDPFSTHRSGFEIRTYRLCRRVLMFHNFAGAPGVGLACLVRSTNFEYDLADATPDPQGASYSTLRSATQWSFQREEGQGADPASARRYLSRQMPPVVFTYSQPVVSQVAKALDRSELENLPVGTQGNGYRWIDLDGEGLPGVLTETAGAWYYKPSNGDGRFGPLRATARVPTMALSGGGRHQFLDLSGDGEVEVVDFSGPVPGFHGRDADGGWKRHVPFANLPNIDWNDPNLRFVDLTGDGHVDALISEQDVFTWHASLEERGFDVAERTLQYRDEDAGPKLIFADGTETIFLADMCGDGLTDLVRIRNGEVCYWPNLGYCRFGRKITLGNSPRFDTPDLFDPRRIRLTDVDGSGPIDIIYLGRKGAQLYFNRAGNSLSNALPITLPVATENLDSVQVADLLGNGTACLVWNSHLPGDSLCPVYYIDLMGGASEPVEEHRRHEKPHLLIQVDNNLGATTQIEYTPSTRFYLQDRLAGVPWATKLPFPVHCVSKVTVRDKWRKTAFSSTYSYHHGYFDGVEREFRGFGRVEQVDTQAFSDMASANADSPFVTADRTLYQPPVKSITWFHTGIGSGRESILRLYAQEYLPARYAEQFRTAGYAEPSLPEPVVDPGQGGDLTVDEWREAMRACKGMPLRQEVYELDFDVLQGTGQHVPVRIFSAAAHNCHIARLQARGGNRHAVFLATEGESFTCQYELDLRPPVLSIDPRIAHTFNLRFDAYGRVLQSVAVAYPRRVSFADPNLSADQALLINRVQRDERHIAYTEARFTDELPFDMHRHRPPVPCEVRTYELAGNDPASGFVPSGSPYFTTAGFLAFHLSDFLPGQGSQPVRSVEYHLQPPNQSASKRLVEHTRTLYFDAGPAVALPTTSRPFGTHDARALKYEDYKLALTDSLLAAVFEDKLQSDVGAGQTAASLLADSAQSGYVPGTQVDPALAGQYWVRSGVAYAARDAFYLPLRYVDPFGNATTLQYDAPLLLVRQTKDALGNASDVTQFDYRVLAPARLRDANHNESAVAFDIRGLPVVSALLGKVQAVMPGAPEVTETGNTLGGFSATDLNPSEEDVSDFFDAQGLDGRERAWLGKASARFIYHFGELRNASGAVVRWADGPAAACSLTRERHEADLANTPANNIPVQVALEYSDGSGQAFVKKVQAEPATSGAPLRWIANGKTIVNNKGKAVLQYEPYFSEDQNGLPDRRYQEPRSEGVSPVMFYDAPGRLVRTEWPDGTLSRVEFSPWFSRTFDQNDTVLDPGNRWYAERTGAGASAEDRRAAALAALHAGTPAEMHLDSLGREVVSIAHNRSPDSTNSNTPLPQRAWNDARYLTFTRMDAEGKPLWIRDARGNLVVQYVRRDAPNPASGRTVNQVEPSTYVPCYDIAGNLLFQHSMDAGDRWMLTDAAGKPMLAWDRNDFSTSAGLTAQSYVFRTHYDALRRPTQQWLLASDDQGNNIGRFCIEVFEYLDTAHVVSSGLDEARRRNLIGEAVRHWDESGCAGLERVDVNGRSMHQTKALLKVDPSRDHDVASHWPDAEPGRLALLDHDTFHRIADHDALGRLVRLYNWHRDITFNSDGSQLDTPGATNRVGIHVPRYDERGGLAGEWVHVRASKSTIDGNVHANLANARGVEVIQKVTRNARGQNLTLSRGNGAVTTCTYDEATFRLVSLKTVRGVTPTGLQDLHYTYDATGNITTLQDRAQKAVWRRNSRIDSSLTYTYDAIYRLLEGTGRENSSAPVPPRRREGTWPLGAIPTSQVPRPYTQRFAYDDAGNFLEMRHSAGINAQWVRHYLVQVDSNRLVRSWYGSNPAEAVDHLYDIHGGMLNLHRVSLPLPTDPDEEWGRQIAWEWRGTMRRFDAIGGGTARYCHGTDRLRTRKHITRVGGSREDRIYLNGFELYRRTDPQGSLIEEIESQHLFDGEQRVLLVDDVITARTGSQPGPNGLRVSEQTLFRYQLGNHLGSVGLELDRDARIISYEEFHPYGTTAYRRLSRNLEVPAKRYRFTGMERDEESGLGSHGARMYSSSLGIWTATDPIGIEGGLNVYQYCDGCPVSRIDPGGTASFIASGSWSASLMSPGESPPAQPFLTPDRYAGALMPSPLRAAEDDPDVSFHERDLSGGGPGRSLSFEGSEVVGRTDAHSMITAWSRAKESSGDSSYYWTQLEVSRLRAKAIHEGQVGGMKFAATYYAVGTAGALGGYAFGLLGAGAAGLFGLGTTGTMVTTGAFGGFGYSLASQGVGVGLGMQSEFSGRQLAFDTVLGGGFGALSAGMHWYTFPKGSTWLRGMPGVTGPGRYGWQFIAKDAGGPIQAPIAEKSFDLPVKSGLHRAHLHGHFLGGGGKTVYATPRLNTSWMKVFENAASRFGGNLFVESLQGGGRTSLSWKAFTPHGEIGLGIANLREPLPNVPTFRAVFGRNYRVQPGDTIFFGHD